MLPAEVKTMLPYDVWAIIAGYVVEPVYKLSPDFEWSFGLLRNPFAVDMIKGYLCETEMTYEIALELANNPNPEFLSYIDVDRFPIDMELCRHKSKEAIEILIDRVPRERWNWGMLSGNPYAIELLFQNPDKAVWREVAENPAAYEFIKKVLIEWEIGCWDSFYILGGIHSKKLFQEIPDRFPEDAVFRAEGLFYEREILHEDSIMVSELCSKPDRLDLLQYIPIKDWSLDKLVENPNPKVSEYIATWLESDVERDDSNVGWLLSHCNHPEVIEFLLEDPDLMAHASGKVLSGNPAAIDALLDNREFVDWVCLADNPNPRAIEVVQKFLPSFQASRLKDAFYKRLDVLMVDIKETEKVKKFYLL